MKIKIHIVLLSLCCLACNNSQEDKSGKTEVISSTDITFNQTKWNTKDGNDYPYRNKMLQDLQSSDTLRHLKKEEVISLLGQPDRIDKNYLFYKIAQEHIGILPFHTKTLFIKLAKDKNAIMIHE
jgi:hypothetical protein